MRVISTGFRKGIEPTYKYKVAGKDKAPHGENPVRCYLLIYDYGRFVLKSLKTI